jgi:hypothetical protein
VHGRGGRPGACNSLRPCLSCSCCLQGAGCKARVRVEPLACAGQAHQGEAYQLGEAWGQACFELLDNTFNFQQVCFGASIVSAHLVRQSIPHQALALLTALAQCEALEECMESVVDVEAWGDAAEQASPCILPANELAGMQRLAQTYSRARSLYAKGALPQAAPLDL